MKINSLVLPISETGLTVLENSYCMTPNYYRRKREVRKLVRSGLKKADVARITGIKYSTVILWTLDMPTCKGKPHISGLTLKALKEIVSKGYIFSGDIGIRSSYKALKNHFPVKRVKWRGTTIFFLEGNERNANSVNGEKWDEV